MFLLFEWDPFHPCVSRSNQIEISFYAHLRGRIGFKTVNPSLSTGKDFLIHSLGKDWWWEECTHPTKTREFLDPFTAKRRDVLGNPSLDKISNPLCRAAKPVLPIYAETMSVHCLESGWIGKSIPLGPRDKVFGKFHHGTLMWCWWWATECSCKVQPGKVELTCRARGHFMLLYQGNILEDDRNDNVGMVAMWMFTNGVEIVKWCKITPPRRFASIMVQSVAIVNFFKFSLAAWLCSFSFWHINIGLPTLGE